MTRRSSSRAALRCGVPRGAAGCRGTGDPAPGRAGAVHACKMPGTHGRSARPASRWSCFPRRKAPEGISSHGWRRHAMVARPPRKRNTSENPSTRPATPAWTGRYAARGPNGDARSTRRGCWSTHPCQLAGCERRCNGMLERDNGGAQQRSKRRWCRRGRCHRQIHPHAAAAAKVARSAIRTSRISGHRRRCRSAPTPAPGAARAWS